MTTVYDRETTDYETSMASGGCNGMDARGTQATSVRDCRLRAKSRNVIRVATVVKPTGGRTDQTLSGPPRKSRKVKPLTFAAPARPQRKSRTPNHYPVS